MILELLLINSLLERLNILFVIVLFKEAPQIFQCVIIRDPGVTQFLNNRFIKIFSPFNKFRAPHFCK